MTRNIILYIATSLDGFIATKTHDLQWLTETQGEGDVGYDDMYQSVDTILMGKTTYDYVMKHTATFPYTDKKCYVFSRQQQGSTKYVTFVNEEIIDFTTKLQKQVGKNIWLVGGAEIIDDFIKANKIDTYIITVTPHILGEGIPLFKKQNPRLHLQLQATAQYGQFVQMHYQVRKNFAD